MINKYLRYCCKYWLFLIFLHFGAESFASGYQSTRSALSIAPADTISGIVLDNNGKPLPNVTVKNLSRNVTVKTFATGNFVIKGKPGEQISFDHPEYYHLEIVLKNDKKNDIQLFKRYLPPSDINLSTTDSGLVEALSVDVLHGRQLKRNTLQSVVTLSNSQLMTTPSAEFLQALPGRMAGLSIGFNSGGPGLDGNGISYNVRQARGNNIVLIDGVQRPYTSIDPDQIESVSVLKDALATVMYGMRSSNGILSITTKKGNRGAPRLSFTAQYGIQTPTALPQPLNASQFATLHNEAQINDAAASGVALPGGPTYTVADIAAYQNGTDPYRHPDVNWYSTVLKPHSNIKRYNFNVQGSGSRFRYFVDVDNLQETGLLRTIDSNTYNTNAQLDRYLVRSNVGMDITKTTTMQLNLFGRVETNNQPGAGTSSVLGLLSSTPRNAYAIFNPNGTLGATSTFKQNIWGQSVFTGYQFLDMKDMSVDLSLTQKLDVLLPGLYAKIQGSYNNSILYNTVRSKAYNSYQYNADNTYSTQTTVSTQGTTGTPGVRGRVTYMEGQMGYDHSFGKNNISVIALADQQSILQFDTGNLPETYSDFATRINYNWDGKYLLEAAGSYAGYNWYAPEKRWAPYWALGLGWNLHKEDFIKENFKWISNLKLRGTYGKTGQVNGAPYFTYIQTYWTAGTNTNNADAYYFGPSSNVRSSGENSLATSGIGPEKAKKLNLGIDLGIMDNKFTLTAEYFKNRFYDLVGTPGIRSAILGATPPVKNIQIFDYWGTDISLTYQNKVHNFNYFVTGNLSMVQSEVIFNAEIPLPNDYQLNKGKQVGIPFGYIATGFFQNAAEINDPKTAVLAGTRGSLQPGDIRYQDRNGDGLIDSKDFGAIGNGKPQIYFGTTVGCSYKGLDVSLLFQGTVNRQTYLSGDFWTGFGAGGNNNAYQYNLGRWTPATAATAMQPRTGLVANSNNNQTSSYWLRNTDFVRLKNAEIGYTLPAIWTKRIGVPSIRFFSNGLNLLTWSELFKIRKDIDPESVGAAYPILKVINFGITAKF
jgi:TonB-linked SusC/RagA family outer membrane protein